MSFQPRLSERYRISTSGARAVEPIEIDGLRLLAIPQLAVDIPGTPVDMNGGNSDTELLVLQLFDAGYEVYQRLDVPGGEDAEFFWIGTRAFLATASVRNGSGPYEYAIDSTIFTWSDGRFVPFQSIRTFGAKQWKHFTIDNEHFLALAQGIMIPGREKEALQSQLYRWTGAEFEPTQTIPSIWGYNWHKFAIGDIHFLAYADHLAPSVLYRWDGSAFVAHQELAVRSGRGFTDFAVDGAHFLVVACIQDLSRVLRWDGERFAEYQTLEGLGARELSAVELDHELFVIRVNFILGAPSRPQPELQSQLYRWNEGQLEVVEEFPTTGGADVAVRTHASGISVYVANALGADARFAATSIIYDFK